MELGNLKSINPIRKDEPKMSMKILINAVEAEECRVAIVKNNRLEEFYIESAAREITQGNIYKATITRIEPSLQAVFVDYGAERNGFLQKYEIHSDYFQDLDSGDRDIRNLVKRGQELLVQVTKEPLMKNLADMADDIFHQVRDSLNPPYGIYGHSMGAMLGYLLTLKILKVTILHTHTVTHTERNRCLHLLVAIFLVVFFRRSNLPRT